MNARIRYTQNNSKADLKFTTRVWRPYCEQYIPIQKHGKYNKILSSTVLKVTHNTKVTANNAMMNIKYFTCLARSLRNKGVAK